VTPEGARAELAALPELWTTTCRLSEEAFDAIVALMIRRESRAAQGAPPLVDAEISDPIRRTLLTAWQDLKGYRVNATAFPRHADRTIEAIAQALATPEPQARQPEDDAPPVDHYVISPHGTAVRAPKS
jgi:hypothetical protein